MQETGINSMSYDYLKTWQLDLKMWFNGYIKHSDDSFIRSGIKHNEAHTDYETNRSIQRKVEIQIETLKQANKHPIFTDELMIFE